MNQGGGIDAGRRVQLVALLEERARLLRLPEGLVVNALVRCVPREGAAPAPIPLAIDIASAPTEPGDGQEASTDGGAVSAATAATLIATAAPESPATAVTLVTSAPPPVLDDALTPRSLARLAGDSGQWDALTAGSIIAGYRIDAPLGAGAMGQVYRAMQMSMNRAVAFKVLAPSLSANPRFRERFLREARAAGRLHHPNLIAVHDVGEADGLMFFSMELVDGTTVSELLRRHQRIPEMRALEICRQTLEALKFAHSHGVVHRDIKPDNLMVTKSGMVKVADLGLARAEDSPDASVTATNTGMMMGTPHYMAPEQGRDAHKVDHRADLYAVGATLFHLVCGHTPFAGDSPMEVLVRASSQPLKFPEPGPSPAVRVLISRLMEKEAGARPQSAEQVLEMISKLRRQRVDEDPDQESDAAVAVARARGRRLRRTLRRLSWYVMGLSIAVVALLLVFGLNGIWQWGRVQEQVAEWTAAHRYHEAIALLDRQPSGSRSQDVARLRTEVARKWDSWAYLQVPPIFRTFREHLRAQRLGEAYTTLQGIGETLRSPGVRKDVEDLQRQWEEAMLAEESREVAQPATSTLVRELWPQEYLSHLGADLLAAFDYKPATAVVLKENTVRFTGVGTATLAASDLLVGRSLRLVVRFPEQDHGDDRWSMPLSGGRELVVRRTGMVLGGAGAERSLAKGGVQYAFAMRQFRNMIEVQTAEAPVWLPLAEVGGPVRMTWSAGGTRGIDLRLRVVPIEKRRK
jgi:hypothetical protein